MRTFDHFNPGFGAVCPVCKTAADAETVLVPIPGTEDGDESCLPDAVQEALEVLNKAIRESRTPEQAISWSPGKTKPKAGSIDITDDLSALVSE